MTTHKPNEAREAMPYEWGGAYDKWIKNWCYEHNGNLERGFFAGWQAALQSEKVQRLVDALGLFDEAMRNGSAGPDAEKHKRRALNAAHKRAKAALTQFQPKEGA